MVRKSAPGIEPGSLRSDCGSPSRGRYRAPLPIGSDGLSHDLFWYPLPDSNREIPVPETGGFTNLPKRACGVTDLNRPPTCSPRVTSPQLLRRGSTVSLPLVLFLRRSGRYRRTSWHGRIRTCNPRINSPLLYPLSYVSLVDPVGFEPRLFLAREACYQLHHRAQKRLDSSTAEAAHPHGVGITYRVGPSAQMSDPLPTPIPYPNWRVPREPSIGFEPMSPHWKCGALDQAELRGH